MNEKKFELSEKCINRWAIFSFLATLFFCYIKIAPLLVSNKEEVLKGGGTAPEVIFYMIIFPFLFITISLLISIIIISILEKFQEKKPQINTYEVARKLEETARYYAVDPLILEKTKELIAEFEHRNKKKKKTKSYTFNQ